VAELCQVMNRPREARDLRSVRPGRSMGDVFAIVRLQGKASTYRTYESGAVLLRMSLTVI